MLKAIEIQSLFTTRESAITCLDILKTYGKNKAHWNKQREKINKL